MQTETEISLQRFDYKLVESFLPETNCEFYSIYEGVSCTLVLEKMTGYRLLLGRSSNQGAYSPPLTITTTCTPQIGMYITIFWVVPGFLLLVCGCTLSLIKSMAVSNQQSHDSRQNSFDYRRHWDGPQSQPVFQVGRPPSYEDVISSLLENEVTPGDLLRRSPPPPYENS